MRDKEEFSIKFFFLRDKWKTKGRVGGETKTSERQSKDMCGKRLHKARHVYLGIIQETSYQYEHFKKKLE